MRRHPILRFVPLAVVCLAMTLPLAAQELPGRSVIQELIDNATPVKSPPYVLPKEHGCFLHSIACGQTINTRLNSSSCQTDDGYYGDLYLFHGNQGQTITADMMSSAFDTLMGLSDPSDNIVVADDDGGAGTNSRITYTLDQTSDEWTLVNTTFNPFTTGPYTLRLQCSGGGPPPPPPPSDGFFTDPAYPDFRFRVRIGDPGDTIDGTREASCQPETVCVSGALPGRSELFIRIIGPRPNGYLWPTLVRFSPSRIVVDIHQVSRDDTNTYTLGAVPPGTDQLSGLQDRTGFLP